ncbi:hypothetical protein Tco_1354579 [Tanacetum coccineum]
MRSKIDTLQGHVDRLHNKYSRLVLKEKKWLLHEIDGLRQDRVAVVSKVIPYVAMELVHSDKMGLLVARLVKTTMFHGRSTSFKEGFNQASDDLATASYPFIVEATADPYASLEKLLSKKPKSLRTKPAVDPF